MIPFLKYSVDHENSPHFQQKRAVLNDREVFVVAIYILFCLHRISISFFDILGLKIRVKGTLTKVALMEVGKEVFAYLKFKV